MRLTDVKVLPLARDDVEQALFYIACDNPSAADDLYNGIMKALERAAEFPYSAPLIAVGGKRCRYYYRIHVKPYNIYYRVIDNNVVVMRVLHERMNADSRL